MDEGTATQTLAGGGIGGAVRVGNTVRRPAGPWTPTVRALLDHLNAAGLDAIPQAHGVDEQGREILSFIDGETVYSEGDPGDSEPGWPDWAFSDELLVQIARWLARYHGAVRSFRPDSPHWRSGARPLAPDEIACHFDVRAANVVVTGTASGAPRLVGVIDWDMAGPGRPLFELALAAWSWIPLWNLEDHHLEEAARRVRLLVSAYGRYSPFEVLAMVPDRLEAALETTAAMAAAGDTGSRRVASQGEQNRLVVARLRDRLPLLAAELVRT